jgi:integrase
VRLANWTLCRSGEIIGARRPEFDLDDALWTIPASRMKKREEHVVPLPTQAVEDLRRLRQSSRIVLLCLHDWGATSIPP